MARKFGKPRHVKTGIINYNLMLLGVGGVGKTTMFKNILDKVAGSDGYMFLEFNEFGADTIEGIPAEDVDSWEGYYDMLDNYVYGYEDIVNDIIENKATDYKNLKVVVWDTLDGFIRIAQDEALALWNKKHPDKKTDTLNATWGGFKGPSDKVKEIMLDSMKKLNKVGVKVWCIGHTATKDVIDSKTGDAYTTLTANIQQTYFNFWKEKMDICGTVYINRELGKEKTNRKNIMTKKDIERTVVKKESRVVVFRDDNYSIDSKSRFRDISGEIEFNPDEPEKFIEVIENAIKEAIKHGNGNYAEAKKEEMSKNKEVEKEVEKMNEKAKRKKEIDDISKKIINFIVENKDTEKEKVKEIVVASKELNLDLKNMDVDDLDKAKKVLSIIE